MTATKIRVKELRMVDPATLLDHPKNWRRHPPTQQAAMQKALDAIGMVDAIVVRETADGLQIIDGHLRHELVEGQIPVLVTDLSAEEGERVLATFDPIAMLAEQDTQQLADLFKGLNAESDELVQSVWPDYMIDPLLAADWAPQPDGDPSEHSRDHRIVCTAAQYEIIQQAVDRLRAQEGDGALPEGRCLELLAADYLSS